VEYGIYLLLRYEFRWNGWNLDHIAEHGVAPEEAQYVVEHPARGYPQYIGDGKYLAKGQTPAGRYLQAIYIFSPPEVVYTIHARPMKVAEKSKLRRRKR